jgi:hypothetical protein
MGRREQVAARGDRPYECGLVCDEPLDEPPPARLATGQEIHADLIGTKCRFLKAGDQLLAGSTTAESRSWGRGSS